MSLYAAILGVAMIAATAMFINGAARWNAWRDADAAATAAARAAVQISTSEYGGRKLHINKTLAKQRVDKVLTPMGYVAQNVTVKGNTVTVTVTADVKYVFDDPIFGNTVTGQGAANVQSGIGK